MRTFSRTFSNPGAGNRLTWRACAGTVRQGAGAAGGD